MILLNTVLMGQSSGVATMPRVAAQSGSLFRRSLPARFSTGWSEDPGEAGRLREVDVLYHRLLLPLLPPPFFSYSYGYHVSPRLPSPANKETAHWFSVTKVASHWLLASPALPRPLSPRSLEEPGKESRLALPGPGCGNR